MFMGAGNEKMVSALGMVVKRLRSSDNQTDFSYPKAYNLITSILSAVIYRSPKSVIYFTFVLLTIYVSKGRNETCRFLKCFT